MPAKHPFLGLVLTATLFAPAAKGQVLAEPGPQQGYFIGGGLRGLFAGGSGEDVDDLGTIAGAGFVLRAGQKLSPELGFGLLLAGGSAQGKVWRLGYGGLGIEAQWRLTGFTSLRGGVLVAGGGLSRVKVSEERDDDPSGAFGPLWQIGISHDIFPWWNPGDDSGGTSVSLYVDAFSFQGDAVKLYGLQVGVELLGWTGLADNRLRGR